MEVFGGHGLVAWIGFNVLVLVLLWIDLGLLSRRDHVIRIREAVVWNVAWVILAAAFGALVWRLYGRDAGIEYVTGYVIERALSVDNIFVFVVVFHYFAVPPRFQKRVLYWGILGAVVMRGALILAGAALVAAVHWVLYVFGAFLIYSGVMLIVRHDVAPDPSRNPVVRVAQRWLPVTHDLDGHDFFTRRGGRIVATRLMLVLIVVETTDVVFALDSIPAIFGVTRDAFVIYSSNVFAILGLRAMYFLVAAILPRFRYLRHGLSLVLVLIGVRMVIEPWVEIPTTWALAAVCLILVGAAGVSLAAGLQREVDLPEPSDPERRERNGSPTGS